MKTTFIPNKLSDIALRIAGPPLETKEAPDAFFPFLFLVPLSDRVLFLFPMLIPITLPMISSIFNKQTKKLKNTGEQLKILFFPMS
jgi:hypothetical protein